MVIARLESPCAPAETSIAPSRIGRQRSLTAPPHSPRRFMADRSSTSWFFSPFRRQVVTDYIIEHRGNESGSGDVMPGASAPGMGMAHVKRGRPYELSAILIPFR